MTTPNTERWTFHGRRYSNVSRKIFYVWHDGTEERRFGKADKNLVIGGLYDVKISREGDRVTMHGVPEFTNQTVSDTLAMRTLDRDAWNQQQRDRSNKRMNELTELDDIVDDLLPHIKSYDDMEAIISVLRGKLQTSLFKRRQDRIAGQ